MTFPPLIDPKYPFSPPLTPSPLPPLLSDPALPGPRSHSSDSRFSFLLTLLAVLIMLIREESIEVKDVTEAMDAREGSREE